MRTRYVLILGLLVVAVLCGCTRSFEMAYEADAPRLANTSALENITLGIAKFEDKRTWVEADYPKSESFVLKKIGLTYKGTDYTPVKDIIQDILIQEFTRSGYRVKAIDSVVSASKSTIISGMPNGQTFDYLLGGEILQFESVLDAGVWTVTNNRNVSINLNLYTKNNPQPVMVTPVVEKETQEYPMAVSIPVCLTNLVNEVFRKAARTIINKTTDSITGARH